MKVIITGASGMLGQAVLREGLAYDKVKEILLVLRNPLNVGHPKVKEVILKDFFDVESISEDLKGYDACFFCAGVSSSSMGEKEYRKITADMTLKFAKVILKANPDIRFSYVSAYGADPASKTMWARVKGEAEEGLKKLGFRKLFIFRPAYTHPEAGIQIKSAWNRRILFFTRPMYRLLKFIFPKHVTTTSNFGKAMILASYQKSDRLYFEVPEINELVKVERGTV